MAKLTVPITTTKVAQTLGTSSHDVATLCEHENINKWSKQKPIRYNSITGLTEEQMSAANFGFPLVNYMYPLAEDALDNAKVNTAWTYNKPRNGIDPHRLGDFRNYNHNAKQPFYINIYATDGIVNTLSPKIYAACGRNVDGDVDFNLEELGVLTDASKSGWCMLYRNTSSSSNPTIVVGVDTATESIDFPLNRPANDLTIEDEVNPGTYDVCVCIWSANQGFVILPDGYKQITVKNETAEQAQGFRVDSYIVCQEGAKRTFYMKFGLLDTNKRDLGSVPWELTIYYYMNGSQRDSQRFSGSQDMDFTNSSTYQYFKITSTTSGQFYTWKDESGLNTATYTYRFTCEPLPQEQYRIVREGDINIIPEGVEIG